MTLIAISVDDAGAQILTDTWSYSPAASRIGRVSKVLSLPHLDLAVATQGSQHFGLVWDSIAAVLSTQVQDFDEFDHRSVASLAVAWAETLESNPDASRSVAFHVGWSAAAGRFVAVAHASDNGFQPEPLDELFVHPSPLSVRPSEIEARHLAALIGDDELGQANLEVLRGRPVPQPPDDMAGWASLALAARERAMLPAATRLKTLVGGTAMLTTLTREGVMTYKLLEFDDTGDELAKVLAGSMHPIGLAGPCPCGSGGTYRECCVEKHIDDPCLCGSGRSSGLCCAVTTSTVTKES